MTSSGVRGVRPGLPEETAENKDHFPERNVHARQARDQKMGRSAYEFAKEGN